MLFVAGLALLSFLILNAPLTQGAATPAVESPIPPVVWEAVHITRGSGLDGCPHDLIADQYLRDLDKVTTHVFREGNLYLALWADAGILGFTACYQGVPQATPQPESFVTERG
jgi:hypothetical protein